MTKRMCEAEAGLKPGKTARPCMDDGLPVDVVEIERDGLPRLVVRENPDTGDVDPALAYAVIGPGNRVLATARTEAIGRELVVFFARCVVDIAARSSQNAAAFADIMRDPGPQRLPPLRAR